MVYLRHNQIHLLLIIILLGFAALGLWMRLLPMDYALGLGQPVVLYEDPWYTVRQVEQILPHFPEYSWFDPMLSFPYGKVVDWGPVFPLFATILAIISGATTQEEIIQAINWAPVLLGLLLIPLTFLIGKFIWSDQVGWISAILISITGGEILFRSSYGYVDHHVMETVLTIGFFVCYFYSLSGFSAVIPKKGNFSHKVPVEDISRSCKEDLIFSRKDILIALCAGLLYYLAIMTMPTCSLIAITVGIITFLFPILIQGRDQLFRLLQINSIIFGLFIIFFAMSGIHVPGWSFSQYSVVHLLIPISIIIESFILYFVSWRVKIQKPVTLLASIVAFVGGLVLIIFQFIPDVGNSIKNVFFGFFWSSGSGSLIQEMNSADLGSILITFNITAILAAFGFILLIMRLIKERNPVHLAAFVWVVVYAGISLMAVRYFYYGGHILVLLSGICIVDIYMRMQSPTNLKSDRNNQISVIPYIKGNIKVLMVTGLLVGLITLLSIPVPMYFSSHDIPKSSVSEEWLESLQWLKNSSNMSDDLYYSPYSMDNFEYPGNMFTVLSWWDYGNWILAITHLSPATNPFQTNIRNVAKCLLSDSNLDAEKTADILHTKYVITTNKYLFDSFPHIQKWLPDVPTVDPYYFYFYQQDPRNKNMLSPMLGMKPAFFNTTLVRLHVNDGSYVQANGSVVIQYQGTIVAGKEVGLLQKMYPVDHSQTIQFLSEPRSNQEIISLIYTSPITDTPALQNYRLIYESNGTRTFPGDVTLNNIKIFERVKGYTIPGTGTIEVPIATNQGRHFTYRQQSENGTFTLPYATTNSPYDVQATGPYRIIETNKTFDVDESQIVKYYT